MASEKPLQLPGREYSEGEETLFRKKLSYQLLVLESRLEGAESRDGTNSSLASKRDFYKSLPTGQEELGGAAAATGTVTSVAAGDGISVSPSPITGSGTVSADLKANGGLVIDSAKVAVDLGASSITGQLANSDLANDSVTVGSTEIDLGATEASISGLTHASGSISSGVTATTQSVLDDSTKLATTAYVDRVALGPVYGSFSKGWDTAAAVTHTGVNLSAINWFTVPTVWTSNLASNVTELSGATGRFMPDSAVIPTGGSRKFLINWSMNLWYYSASTYLGLAGRITKTPSGGSAAEVPGSAQTTGWDQYLGPYLGSYFYMKSVASSAMVSLASGDTVQFQYGVNSVSGSGTTTVVAYRTYESGLSVNITAMD